MTTSTPARVEFDFEFPLGEIMLDFFDKLKSISRGLRVARLRDGRAIAESIW